MVAVFMGYDSQPAVNRATLHAAAQSLTAQGKYAVVSWEDLRIDGQIIIGRITAAIDSSEVALFDVTTLNPNVLFELGYAIATRRRVGLLMEEAADSAAQSYKRFGLLRGVGYHPWSDTGSIVAKVSGGGYEAATPMGDALIDAAPPLAESSVLFVPALHRSEPDSKIRSLVQRASGQRLDVIVADPAENRLESLTWYVAKSYSCAATLLHFESPLRKDHSIHNARLALVGGLACGFGRPLLMLANEAYSVPLDYADLLKRYSTPSEAEAVASKWLESLQLPAALAGGQGRGRSCRLGRPLSATSRRKLVAAHQSAQVSRDEKG